MILARRQTFSWFSVAYALYRGGTFLLSIAALTLCGFAHASGPRYVTGPPFFTGPAGVAIGWRQPTLLYFTDPGGLGSGVDHQAADTLVAAAVGVWNLPVASITIAQGGNLAEHVSSQNTTMNSSGLNFPADVLSSNAAAIPVSILYDTDGSITDLLLGAGASGPSSCLQNAVTESVDSFDPAGFILHAMVILNGRCIGPTPEQRFEMQYQLERAFGRVLGLAWSQTNDNVFTGSPTPTYNQALNWPIMHPIDIACGSFAYQCLPMPFQLRADDMAGMVNLYPVQAGSPPRGKQVSLGYALGAEGHLTFPSGEGMAGVNVLIRRQAAGLPADGWFENSAVSGTSFRRSATSPFVASAVTPTASFGTLDPTYQGFYSFAYIPIESSGTATWQNLITSVEPVNPLYIGSYSLGPYAPGVVSPSGSLPQPVTTYVDSAGNEQMHDFNFSDGASSCGDGSDGTASAPAQVPSSGWWHGLLCGYGHASYLATNVRPNRSFTIEVTALDEQGLATEAKAMPVIAVFNPSDGALALPTLAVTPAAFQALTFATTTLQAQTGQVSSIRVGIADQRGEGRPDFNFQARLFYADAVTPATVPAAGGILTLTGLGFRTGNAVAINGVPVTVLSYSANTLVVSAAPMAATNAGDGVAVDVVVSDSGTGASSTLYSALTYHAGPVQPNSMRILTAQAGSVFVGDVASVPFAVQVVGPDGVTPVVGDRINFSASAGGVRFGCPPSGSSNACTVSTDSTGVASIAVTPTSAGSVTLQAADATLSQSASFTAVAQPGSIVVFSAPSGNLPVGVAAQPYFFVRVFTPQGVAIAGAQVTFSVPAGSATFSGCFTATCTVTADANGAASVFITPTVPGAVTIQASVGDVQQQISFVAVANADTLQVTITPTSSVYNNAPAGQFQVRLLHADGSPDYFQTVTFTASSGASIDQCATSTCTMITDWGGLATISLTAHQVGAISVQATFGGATQTVHVNVIDHSWQLHLVSAPSGDVSVGSSLATPFTAQVLLDGATPVSGLAVALAGPGQQVLLSACNSSGCALTTDANGMVSTTVTALQAGTITLSATLAPTTLTASFTALGQADSMRVVLQPASAGELVGDLEEFETQLVGADGSSPIANQTVTYSVVSGPFAFLTCNYASCSGQSDNNGMNFVYGEVTGPGVIVVQAVSGNLSQSFTFTAAAKPDILKLLTSPASGSDAGVAAALPFAVQAFFGDGVSFAAGRSITLSVTSGTATFAACAHAASCVVDTDASGNLSTLVTPTSAGTITLVAAETATPSISQTATFTSAGGVDTLQVVSAPTSGSYTGTAASTPFTVQVLQWDGTSAAAGKSITVSVVSGMATLAGCGNRTSCILLTDAFGKVSSGVTAVASGSITLSAFETLAPSVMQTATFSAVAPGDILHLVSDPESSAFAGNQAPTAFSVRLTLSDGSTPVVGAAITFTSQGSGTARLLACGASTCTLLTAADGTASTLVSAVAPGMLTLVATPGLATGALALSAPFEVFANQQAISVTPAQTWIAEGATLSLPLSASAGLNGSPATGLALHWTGTTGFVPAATDTRTNAAGASSLGAAVGPLNGSSSAAVTVCGWSSVCQSFTATAVSPQNYQVTLVSGGQQTVQGGQQLLPVVVRITDLAGHPIVSAPVTISQTLTAFDQACPTHGRCPAASILNSQALAVVSALDGSVSITPLASPGSATQTEIAISAGSTGFVALTLTSNP